MARSRRSIDQEARVTKRGRAAGTTGITARGTAVGVEIGTTCRATGAAGAADRAPAPATGSEEAGAELGRIGSGGGVTIGNGVGSGGNDGGCGTAGRSGAVACSTTCTGDAAAEVGICPWAAKATHPPRNPLRVPATIPRRRAWPRIRGFIPGIPRIAQSSKVRVRRVYGERVILGAGVALRLGTGADTAD